MRVAAGLEECRRLLNDPVELEAAQAAVDELVAGPARLAGGSGLGALQAELLEGGEELLFLQSSRLAGSVAKAGVAPRPTAGLEAVVEAAGHLDAPVTSAQLRPAVDQGLALLEAAEATVAAAIVRSAPLAEYPAYKQVYSLRRRRRCRCACIVYIYLYIVHTKCAD